MIEIGQRFGCVEILEATLSNKAKGIVLRGRGNFAQTMVPSILQFIFSKNVHDG